MNREHPVESLRSALAFSSRDWSKNHRDAWVFGIICGWEGALGEVAERHGWTPETVARLRRLRARFQGYSPSSFEEAYGE